MKKKYFSTHCVNDSQRKCNDLVFLNINKSIMCDKYGVQAEK